MQGGRHLLVAIIWIHSRTKRAELTGSTGIVSVSLQNYVVRFRTQIVKYLVQL